MIAKILFVIIVGLACGLAVGAGFVAFITVLSIIPRLMQLTKTMTKILYYEAAVVLGVVSGAWLSLQEPVFSINRYFLLVFGLFYGVFVGMLSAALTEVLNVFPLLAKRIKLQERLLYLLMAMVFGKIFGSLFHWIFFVDM
ncbi:stage V sporulation protein AB [Caldibacillus lycopersici]|uniref:Stage V sporulation protein AB n=1 Tax=Perspicuibacillus lycopersici TaxID=1325689 RepID=A0AAE3ISE5_9BACI|nr:stage V sporulation protein AB [Perspicuibacillus lycopersici]MCU9613760.1 stage V sporulation protein AB [Perspicuibacillus lycopersici]